MMAAGLTLVVAAGLVLAAETHLSSTGIVLGLVASAVLILVNGFFVAYEFAAVAARRSAFEEEQAGNGRVARAVRASLSDLSLQLAGAQLGITMASLALARVGEPALEAIVQIVLGDTVSPEVARAIGFGTALGVFTFLHLIIGEMVPKNVALAIPEATMRWSVLPYRVYLLLFRPVLILLNAVANGACRAIGIEPRDELMSVHTASELAAIVHHSQEGGAIDEDDAELLQGALEFARRPVAGIATVIDDHPSVILGATAVQLERMVAQSGFHRILVLSPTSSRPIGYVHARDLLEIPPELRRAPIPVGIVRQTAVVNGDRSLIQVLRLLRRARRQLAVVESADGTTGVVSVEEVIRALVEPASESAGRASSESDGQHADQGDHHADPLDVLGQILSAD
ncbi:MAG: CNNM domain-containing protein [Acidimicrobiia bacterium]|nr:CNNM domain-containing protein [Acidimicrobiia bacterium]